MGTHPQKGTGLGKSYLNILLTIVHPARFYVLLAFFCGTQIVYTGMVMVFQEPNKLHHQYCVKCVIL